MYIDNSNLYDHQISTLESTTNKYYYNRSYSWPPNNVKDYDHSVNMINYLMNYIDFSKHNNIKEQIDFSTKTKIDDDDIYEIDYINEIDDIDIVYVNLFKLKTEINGEDTVAVKEYPLKDAYQTHDKLKYNFILKNGSLLQEVYGLVKLKNEENIVKILGCFLTEKRFNIVMECADLDLEKYIRFVSKQKEFFLSSSNIAYILREFLFIIQACSNYNIVNTDIKSANLLVFFEDRKIKLCDFERMLEFSKYGIMVQKFIDCIKEIFSSNCDPILKEYAKNIIDIDDDINKIVELAKDKFNFFNYPYKTQFSKKLSYRDPDIAIINTIASINTNIKYILRYESERDFNKIFDINKSIKLLEQKCDLQPFPIEY